MSSQRDRKRYEQSQDWRERLDQPFNDSALQTLFNRTIATYALPDGTIVNQQCRYDPKPEALQPGVDAPNKRFWPRRPADPARCDPEVGPWVFGAGERRVIYNWRAIIQAGPGALVWVCEGEANANALIQLGLLATTVISHKWTPECVNALAGYELMVLADNDEAGVDHAAKVHGLLAKVAKTIRLVPLAHLWRHLPPPRHEEPPPPNGDIADWLAAGGAHQQLATICRKLAAEGEICAKVFDCPAEADLPKWEFLLGKHLLRGTVSGSAAMGGVGKSTISIVEALALVSTKPIPGFEQPSRPQRVWLINYEDNRNAMAKRITAAMKHYGLRKADIGDRLIVSARGEVAAKIAKQIRGGTVERNEPFIQGLCAYAEQHKIDVLSVDPLVKTHGVNENDNSAMEEVVDCYGIIADRMTIFVHLWHHTRKGNGQTATIDAARGASAFVDGCRCVRILETMTKDDALTLNIMHPGFFFRAFNGKLNFAPPVEQSDWYKFENVELDNGGPLFGDSVGVVTAWQRPGTAAVDLTPYLIEQIRQAVGPPPPRWREDSQAGMWVGKAVAPVLGLDWEADKAAVKKVVQKLRQKGSLTTVVAMGDDRKPHPFIVAAPLAEVQQPSEAQNSPEVAVL